MELKTYFAQDASGNIMPGAAVTVYVADTLTLATGLLDENESALTNPFNADSDAKVAFYAPDGLYDINVVSGIRNVTIRAQFVSIDGAGILRTDLASSSVSKGSKLVAYILRAVGAVARWVEDKLAETVSVLDFGADPTGTADSTAAIQAAMAYSTTAGRRLLFPAGHYLCGKIDVPSNLWVVADPGAVIVRTANFGWCLSVYTSPISNVTIEGLQFDCNAPGTAGTHKHSVFIRESFNVTIRNCRFFNGYDIAIKVLGPDGIMIESLNPTVRNNILVENCTFDGFTRNGCSVTDGANGITFRGNTFTNCGLAGLDVEANTGSSTQVYDLVVEGNKFINNGAGSIRGTDLAGAGLAIFSASPAAFHSKNVTVKGNYFLTTTAVNTLGINYLRVNSADGLIVDGNVFDTPGTASIHKVILEEDTFGSRDGAVSNNIFRNVSVWNFKFDNFKFRDNILVGGLAYLTGASQGAGKVIAGNTFDSCGGASQSPVRMYGPDLTIMGNKFVETRASGVPAIVLDILAGANTTSLTTVSHLIEGNTVTASSALYGAFMNISGGSASFGVGGVDIKNNRISGCTLGVQIASDGGSPNSFDINVIGNTFYGLAGRALRFYRVSRFTAQNNIITDCATNNYAIGIDSCQRYSCQGNTVIDTRTLTSRMTYAVIAFSSPVASALIANNLSVNTQSGFDIAGSEGTSANNIAY